MPGRRGQSLAGDPRWLQHHQRGLRTDQQVGRNTLTSSIVESSFNLCSQFINEYSYFQVCSSGEAVRRISWEEFVHSLPVSDRGRHGHEHALQGKTRYFVANVSSLFAPVRKPFKNNRTEKNRNNIIKIKINFIYIVPFKVKNKVVPDNSAVILRG